MSTDLEPHRRSHFRLAAFDWGGHAGSAGVGARIKTKMAAHNDFFTWQSLTTFAGTTMATTAIVNGVCSVLPGFRHAAALGLSVSIVLCLLFAMIDPSTGEIVLARPFATYLIALVNGFFVFTSAAGISAGGARAAGASARGAGRTRGGAVPSGGITSAPDPAPRRFWHYWL